MCTYVRVYINRHIGIPLVCVCVCVCVWVEFLFLRKLPLFTVLRECRGQWPTQESTANEATLEMGGYPG